MKECPCKTCDLHGHDIKCHATCDKGYLEWKTEKQKSNKKRDAEYETFTTHPAKKAMMRKSILRK
jgi:hypothetical protein